MTNKYYKQGQTVILDGCFVADMDVSPYDDDRGPGTKIWTCGTIVSNLRPTSTITSKCGVYYTYTTGSSAGAQMVFGTLTIQSNGTTQIQFTVPQYTIAARSKVNIYLYNFGYRLN